ncbi:unnamed protein product, partial [Didymodactylos carnosus]
SEAKINRFWIRRQALKAHNEYRTKHCAPPLTLSRRLNGIAQKYAEHLASTKTFEHSHTKGLGENLWMLTSSEKIKHVKGSAATKDWYDEVQHYNFGQPGFSHATGHFTQLVWNSSKKMGLGVALSSDKKSVYVVANYEPAGNTVNAGYFEKNVLEAKC